MRHPLLEAIVDYAGLFPPASLAMGPAVEEYARQRVSAHAWMLAAFVVPALRLDEFAAEAQRVRGAHPPGEQRDGAWPLSVLLGADPLADLALLPGFAREHDELGHAVAVEFRPASEDQIAAVAAAVAAVVPDGADVFCELPWTGDLAPWLSAVHRSGAWAKIRTGGVTADLVPPIEAVAGFLRACRAAGVGLKFTAGLHHPLRARYALSYASDAPVATMHGFLNVFFAAIALATSGPDDARLREILSDDAPASFELEPDGGLRWRSLRLDPDAVRSARHGFARSFGSCSFAEPVRDLQTLGMP